MSRIGVVMKVAGGKVTVLRLSASINVLLARCVEL
jgi:hypothetical protein